MVVGELQIKVKVDLTEVEEAERRVAAIRLQHYESMCMQARIDKLSLEAGDVLVVQSQRLFSRDQCAAIDAYVRRQLPVDSATKILILDDGMSLTVLQTSTAPVV